MSGKYRVWERVEIGKSGDGVRVLVPVEDGWPDYLVGAWACLGETELGEVKVQSGGVSWMKKVKSEKN